MKACHFPDCLRLQARENPSANALSAPECEPLTYGKLQHLISASVQSLADLGISRSDRIAVVLPNGLDMAFVCLAVPAAAVFAPLNPKLRAAEFESALDMMKATAVLVEADSESEIVGVARRLKTPLLRWKRAEGAFGGAFCSDAAYRVGARLLRKR